MIVEKYIKLNESFTNSNITTYNRSGRLLKWFRPDGTEVNIKLVDKYIQASLASIQKGIPSLYEYISSKDLVYTDRIKTMSTDGRRIWVNPSWCERVIQNKGADAQRGLMFVLCHEAMHIVLHHCADGEKYKSMFPDSEVQNIAMDYQVNYFIENYVNLDLSDIDAGFFKGITKIMNGKYNEDYADLLWQKIYPKVTGEKEPKKKENLNTGKMWEAGFKDAVAGYFKKLRKEGIIESYEVK